MKGMKLVSIIIWLFLGIFIIATDNVNNFNYGILLFLYLMESIWNLIGIYVHGE